MADVTTYLTGQDRSLDTGTFIIKKAAAVANAAANNGDRIQLLDIEHGMRLFDLAFAISATLGAGCTLKLQRDRAGAYTDLTVASTAAAANDLRMTASPLDLQAGDKIVALVGGANVGAAATVTVDLLAQRS